MTVREYIDLLDRAVPLARIGADICGMDGLHAGFVIGAAVTRAVTRPCPLYDAIRNGLNEAIAKARRRCGHDRL